MGIFFKKEKDYVEAVMGEIFSQTGIFSYQAGEGEAKAKFSQTKFCCYSNAKVRIAELLNYLLRGCDLESLAAFSEESYEIIQAMNFCAVIDSTKKRSLTLFKEEKNELVRKRENGSTDYTLNDFILIETSKEKIERVMRTNDQFMRIKKIIYLFGSQQEYNDLCPKIVRGSVEIQQVLPLEHIVREYLKRF